MMACAQQVRKGVQERKCKGGVYDGKTDCCVVKGEGEEEKK